MSQEDQRHQAIAAWLQSASRQLQVNSAILQEDDEDEGVSQMQYFRAGEEGEEGELVPPPDDGLSAAERAAIRCQDTLLVRAMEEAKNFVPGVGRGWSESNETASRENRPHVQAGGVYATFAALPPDHGADGGCRIASCVRSWACTGGPARLSE